MQPRVTLITLGVRNLERAVAFYRDGLGWPPSGASVEGEVAFFRTGGTVLALWSREAGNAFEMRTPDDRKIPFSPRDKNALVGARKEMRRLGDNHLGTEHGRYGR